jgi:hypothetical protein
MEFEREVGTTDRELGAVAVKAPSPVRVDDIVVVVEVASPPPLAQCSTKSELQNIQRIHDL